MKTLNFLFFVILFLLSAATEAQSDFKVEVLKNVRSDIGLSYNFFTGGDSDDFRTTIKGFGSGFMFDFLSGRYSIDYMHVGTDRAFLSLGAGVAVSKYRFSENLIFTQEGDDLGYFFDDDPAREYGDGFFSYGKSKLVSVNLILPVNFNVNVGEFLLSAGGTADFYLHGKHKRKFKEGGEKKKILIDNNEFNDFPVNKTKFGIGGMILHKPTGMNFGVTYMLTPFFKEDQGPELNEVRISVSYNISYHSY